MAHHSLSKSLKIAGGIGLGAAILVVVAGRYFAPAFGVLSFLWLPVAIAIAIGAAIWILPAERLEQLLAKGLVRGLLIGLGLAAFYGVFGWLIYSNLPKLETFWNLSLLETGFLLVAITLVLVPVPAVIIGLFKATGIPIDPVNIGKWSRRVGIVILAILLVSGLSREGWREKWVRPAVAAVRPAAGATAYRTYLPQSLWPAFATRPCDRVYSARIPSARAERDALVRNPDGNWTVFWTGASSYDLLGFYEWPEGVEQARLRVRHVRGHLDIDDSWDPETEEHLTDEVTRSRNYTPGNPNSFGYCREEFRLYSATECGLENYLGPGQTALIVECGRPGSGVWPFSRGTAEVVVSRGQRPILLFNNWNPPGNGRLHRAEFMVTISPT